jgi:uncharacterized repeat protein (TIGR01451 family)
VRVTRRALLGAIALAFVAALQAPASAAPILGATASQAASAMAAAGTTVTGASFPTSVDANTAAVFDTSLASFPTSGTTFAVLSSGDAGQADDPATTHASTSYNGGSRSGSETATDQDVTVLKIDLTVPPDKNCLSIDFKFLSEEFPGFVGGAFNDAFIAELDSTTWTTSGSSINAPNNFAFDPTGNVISVNGTGVADMSLAEAGNTPYGGATTELRASSPVTPGAHSVFFTIFDQGDTVFDSAVFLDGLSLGATVPGGCQTGAQLPPPVVTKTADNATSAPESQNGYEITVTNPNATAVSLDSIVDTLPPGFSYVTGSTTGVTTEDPSIEGQTLTWSGPFELGATGQVSLEFDVTVASEAGQYPNEASATAEGFTIESTGPVASITVESPCEPVSLEGTDGGNKLAGTAGADRVQALGGRDHVDAMAGVDEVCGGDGGDYLYGRAGPDRLLGDNGNDRLYGGDQADVLEGGPGHDAFIPGRGNDVILAEDGTVDCIQRRPGDQIERDPDDIVRRRGCAPGFWVS